MKARHIYGALPLLGVLASCTTLTAPEETKSLKYAAETFTSALTDADTADSTALSAARVETLRNVVARGASVRIEEGCAASAEAWRAGFIEALATPSDWRRLDVAYGARTKLKACDIPNRDILPAALPHLPDSLADPDHVLALDSADLTEAASDLNDYVEALADIAGAESSGKADAARHKAVASIKGLAAVLDSKNGVVGPLFDLVSTIADSLIAARRNAETRRFINDIDSNIPDLMERLGLAARIKLAQALVDRARAAHAVAQYGNLALKPPRKARADAQTVNLERLATFDEISDRLESHNSAFRGLRSSDPMRAARAFAKAHRALRDVYNDPKANRQAFQTAFHEFATSATALAKALRKADAE